MKIREIFTEYLNTEKTLKKFSEKLKDAIESDDSAQNITPEVLLEKFIEADPTNRKGSYVLWQINTYLRKGFKYSDLDKLKSALFLYHKFKHQLALEKRDVNKIKSLNELENLVEQFREQKTGREIKKDIKQKIMNETDILYNGKDGLLLIPRTVQSSCFWGKGTKWCTASKKSEESDFDIYYDKSDPEKRLLIFITKDGKKYQFSTLNFEFADEKDENLNLREREEFFKKYPELSKEFFKYLVNTFLHSFDKLQNLVLTLPYFDKFILEFSSENQNYLENQNIVEIVGKSAIRYNKENILKLVADKLSDKTINEALRKNKNYLKYFNINNLNYENQLYVIRKIDPEAIFKIKNPPRDLIEEAIKSDPKLIKHFQKIFSIYSLTDLIYEKPYIFKYIENPDLELMKKTADRDIDILFTNNTIKDYREIIDYILKKDPRNYYKIPFHLRTKEIENLAKKYGL